MNLFGKILDIDLVANTWKFAEYPLELASRYLGGRGLNVHFLYDQLPTDIDPLGPENLLIFSCGLLTGTAVPSSARLHINALSPLTGLLGSSNIGGGFGARGPPSRYICISTATRFSSAMPGHYGVWIRGKPRTGSRPSWAIRSTC